MYDERSRGWPQRSNISPLGHGNSLVSLGLAAQYEAVIWSKNWSQNTLSQKYE